MATAPTRSLGVARAGEACLFELPPERLPVGGFRVRTLYSGLSAGTELTYFKGTNPYLHARWNAELGLFEEGAPSTRFPVRVMGYMEVARVTEASDGAPVEPGQLVGMRYGHKTAHAADPARDVVVPLPEGLDPLLGIYAAQMGPICVNGLLHAAAERSGGPVAALSAGVRDRRVLVTGAGVVGLLTALLAAEHGASEVAVADRSARRLAAAEALGLEAIDDARTPAWRVCKDRWRDGAARGADVAFQCRGRAEDLHAALRSLRPQGTVIDLAFYQGGAPALRLGEEFHHNGLAIRCAQIGRVPLQAAAEWDRARLAAETVELLARRGRDIRRHVITDVVPLEQGPELIAALAARRREVIQAVFACDGDGRTSDGGGRTSDGGGRTSDGGGRTSGGGGRTSAPAS
jgi:threonine dehydrogenase-like Zn-dependent dehydrogenase